MTSIAANQYDELSESWKRLRAAPLQGASWQGLAAEYLRLELPWQAGYAARQVRRCPVSADQPLSVNTHVEFGADDTLLGRAGLADAKAICERFQGVVDVHSGDWLTWLYLARLREMLDESVASDIALDQARTLEPIPGESQHWMGVWRLNAGDAAGAVTALSTLVDSTPLRHGSMMYLGEALLRVGNYVAAEKAFNRAALSPNPDFLLNLAGRVYAHNYWQEAIAILRQMLALVPDKLAGWLTLAKIQSEVYELAGCRDSLERIKALDPGNHEAALLEAGLLGRMGDAHGHFEQLQRIYEVGGDPLSRLASSVAMTSLYHDGLSAGEVAALHRKLCAPIEAAVKRQMTFDNERTYDRRLRIGYVTGDLHRQHPVNLFMLPVLQRHDREKFELCIYHTGTMHDEYTRQARACADRWLDAAMLDDRALHQSIVADGIDILIDLAGHTSTHRLGVFAMRAAPVQATFLGYPHSTGLSSIDWLIGDPIVSPAEHAPLFSEGIVQLPDSVFCWAPVDDYSLPSPRRVEEPVVFGSFNNAMKLSPSTVGLWARVLKAVPGSFLLLKAPSLRDADVRDSVVRRFAEHAVAADRLILRGPSGLADMMHEYGDMDIALDPLPYNGGTTTLQALWMGVPVISLAGGNFVGRMGASFLATLGHADWVATDEADYIACARRLAGQVDGLRTGRAMLREMLGKSPLCAIHEFVAHLESAYRRMWETYCGDRATRQIAIPRQTIRSPQPAPPTRIAPMESQTPASSTPSPELEISTSRQMLSWLAEQKLSLAFTTYQIGKLFFLGLKSNQELSIFERSFNRCMGLCTTRNGLYMSSLYQIWRFENLFTIGQIQDDYDRLYLPQVGYTTGDLDVHDMAVDGDGRLVFVNTLFGCLATLSETHSFKPLWRPPFVSKLAAEDRCHLNGLAMVEGVPAFVTAVGVSDVADGWREHRVGGGILMDVRSNDVVLGGLSMPHSPRWHQGKLWLLNSGTGEFGYADCEKGRFEPVTFCPGYMRGLAFHGDFALVGLSRPRHNKTFSGLPLDDALTNKGAEPRCGIQVIDLRSGDVVHWVRIEGMVEELYDVVTLPDVRRPMALGFKTDEIRRVLSVEE